MGVVARVLNFLGLGGSKKTTSTKSRPAKKATVKKAASTPSKKKAAATPKRTTPKRKAAMKAATPKAATPKRKAATPTRKASGAAKKSKKKPTAKKRAEAFDFTYLECVEGNSSKYWKIAMIGPTTTQVFNGPIGAPRGTSQPPKEHPTPTAAAKHYEKMVASKLKRGYKHA